MIEILFALICAVKVPSADLALKLRNHRVLKALPLVVNRVSVEAFACAIQLASLNYAFIVFTLHGVDHGRVLAALMLPLLLHFPLRRVLGLSLGNLLILRKLFLLLLDCFVLIGDGLRKSILLFTHVLSLLLSLFTCLCDRQLPLGLLFIVHFLSDGRFSLGCLDFCVSLWRGVFRSLLCGLLSSLLSLLSILCWPLSLSGSSRFVGIGGLTLARSLANGLD